MVCCSNAIEPFHVPSGQALLVQRVVVCIVPKTFHTTASAKTREL